MVQRAGIFLLLALTACSYLLPASWRAFRADPDDAAPAITRALDSAGSTVETFDQRKRQITTRWSLTSTGVMRVRERYIVTWERDPKEESLTVYVRHEQQEQEIGEAGATKWGATSHDDEREGKLLDRIAKELEN